MKITRLKKLSELTPYESEEGRDAASKEELHEALWVIDQSLNTLGKLRNAVYSSLQDKMCKNEQLFLDFGAYTYEVKKEVKRKFNNDFASTEDEAKFLEDNGFSSFVSRTEETVNTVKVNRAQVKKAYEKNSMPESVASHYNFTEEENVKVYDPVLIQKDEEE